MCKKCCKKKTHSINNIGDVDEPPMQRVQVLPVVLELQEVRHQDQLHIAREGVGAGGGQDEGGPLRSLHTKKQVKIYFIYIRRN